LPPAAYGFVIITPPSAHVAIPATFGAITHSAPSMNAVRNHSTASHGRTPSSSIRFPSTIRRWMWCA
jgi:hypothetical protein